MIVRGRIVRKPCIIAWMQTAQLTFLGKRIRERRKLRGWSQEQLADCAGVDRSYVGGIERGERNITFTMLCQLAKALEITVADLVTDLPGGFHEVA